MQGSAGVLLVNCPYIEQLAGHKVIRFEGSPGNTFLGAVTPINFFQGINSGHWNKSFTGIGIMRQDGFPTSENTFHCFKANSANSLILLDVTNPPFYNTLRWIVRTANGQAVNLSGGVILNQGWKIICWQWDHPNKTARLIINGNVFSGQNLAMDDFDFQIPTSSYLVASEQTIPGILQDPLTGYMGEFCYYSDVKNNAEINKLGNYFATKYGLSWINI